MTFSIRLEDKMLGKIRLVLLSMALLLLVGCGGRASWVASAEDAVNSATVTRAMQALDELTAGPTYNVSMTVPASWVNQFKTVNQGNTLQFVYTGKGTDAPIFSIKALSANQYWMQSGSYPGSFRNIVNRGDTFFVSYAPIDTYYSGLSAAELAAFTAEIPGILQSFTAEIVRNQ